MLRYTTCLIFCLYLLPYKDTWTCPGNATRSSLSGPGIIWEQFFIEVRRRRGEVIFNHTFPLSLVPTFLPNSSVHSLSLTTMWDTELMYRMISRCKRKCAWSKNQLCHLPLLNLSPLTLSCPALSCLDF